MKIQVVLFALLVLVAQSVQAAVVPILRFRQVSPGLYRGARPDAEGLKALAQLGIKVDLDLENDLTAVRQETAQAQELGLRIISQPMSGFWAPKDTQVNEILAILADQSNYPLFIHCLHGEDRTGLIVGLYRVFQQGWSPADAYQEMKDDGFHPLLLPLNHYFETKTGFED